MSLFNRVACEKEIEIAGMKLENNVADIIALTNIDAFYEAGNENKKSLGAKMKEATSKIIAEVKKFFQNLKETIAKKYREIKRTIDMRQLERMWKNNINNVVTITDYADEKRIRKLYGDALTIGRKYTEKIVKCGSIEKAEALMVESKQKLEKIEAQIDELRATIKFNLRDNMDKIDDFDDSMDDLDDMLEDAVDAIATMYDSIIDESTEKAIDEGKSVNPSKIGSFIHSIQAKLVAIGKKIANIFSHNKTKLMSALSSLGHKANKVAAE